MSIHLVSNYLEFNFAKPYILASDFDPWPISPSLINITCLYMFHHFSWFSHNTRICLGAFLLQGLALLFGAVPGFHVPSNKGQQSATCDVIKRVAARIKNCHCDMSLLSSRANCHATSANKPMIHRLVSFVFSLKPCCLSRGSFTKR